MTIKDQFAGVADYRLHYQMLCGEELGYRETHTFKNKVTANLESALTFQQRSEGRGGYSVAPAFKGPAHSKNKNSYIFSSRPH